jgi:hypothetical protein
MWGTAVAVEGRSCVLEARKAVDRPIANMTEVRRKLRKRRRCGGKTKVYCCVDDLSAGAGKEVQGPDSVVQPEAVKAAIAFSLLSRVRRFRTLEQRDQEGENTNLRHIHPHPESARSSIRQSPIGVCAVLAALSRILRAFARTRCFIFFNPIPGHL